MAKSKRKKPRSFNSDYDGAWKEALRQHLRLFLAIYFPAIAASIDWNSPVEWLDKELSRILGRGKNRPKSVDVLTKVLLLSGEEQWILLHLEVQAARESEFELRIARYNSGLFWSFHQRVVSLVVLADLDEHWRPSEDHFRLADFESRLKFPTCKLIDRLATDWRDNHSLPVQIARAQIAALRTASDPVGRYLAKWQLMRNLYGLGYNPEDVREMLLLIDWMIKLPEELDQKFERELSALEEELSMPYVTSMERIAEARGEARGEAKMLLKVLRRDCGALPPEIEQKIRQLSIDKLDALSDAALEMRSANELQSWLNAHA